MQTAREEALNMINKLPNSVNYEEIMHRLYVMESIHQAETEILEGKVLSHQKVKEESEAW